MKKQSRWNKNWMEKQKRKNLCVSCNNKKLKHSNLCKKHWFVSKATGNLGDIKMATEIEELFNAQNARCYLTGEKLILGKNASLDHFIPQSKAPELKCEIRNLGWCTKKINKLKNNFSIEELIKICKNVVDFYEKTPEN